MKKISFYTIMLSSFMVLSSYNKPQRIKILQKKPIWKEETNLLNYQATFSKTMQIRILIQSLLKVDVGYGEELSFAYLINNSKLVKLNEMGLTADLKSTENLKKTISESTHERRWKILIFKF